MFVGKFVFAQLMDFLPLHTFRRCVARYPSNYPTKTFSHLDQYLSMTFAQLTFRESLRDIEVCLRAHESKIYHLGIRGHVARSNIGDANEKRDWRIYRDFASTLIVEARQLYAGDAFGVDLENTVYAQRISPHPTSVGVVLLRIAPEIISVLGYSKGFGHSDLITFSERDLDLHIECLRHRWDDNAVADPPITKLPLGLDKRR